MRLRLLLVVLCWLPACGPSSGTPGEGEAGTDALVRMELDQADPERLLRYYFGGYAADTGADPFEAGLVVRRDGALYVDRERLAARHPALAAQLEDTDGNDRIAWEELAAFLQATYYDARPLPPTLEALRAEVPYRDDPDAWLHVEIDGVMTTARRHVYVPYAALRQALQHYHQNDEQLHYPVGTTLVGEHRAAGDVAEVTAMRKRADGFWDFFTYGPGGRLAAATHTPPRQLKSPTQCVGCHFGSRGFEPEKSFPAEAPPGPHGPRGLYIDPSLRDPDVVAFFNEHSKRSDTVLGLYNTLFVAQLRADRRAGQLDPADARLLEELGL